MPAAEKKSALCGEIDALRNKGNSALIDVYSPATLSVLH